MKQETNQLSIWFPYFALSTYTLHIHWYHFFIFMFNSLPPPSFCSITEEELEQELERELLNYEFVPSESKDYSNNLDDLLEGTKIERGCV